jgi:hypothetical protein
LGKFLQVDPMADKYGSLTTYNYAGNNPVIFNDPNGDDFWDDIMQLPSGSTWENPDKEEQDYQPGVSPFGWMQEANARADAMFDAMNGVYNPLWNQMQYGAPAPRIGAGFSLLSAMYVPSIARQNVYFTTPLGDRVSAQDVLDADPTHQNPKWRAGAMLAFLLQTINEPFGQDQNFFPSGPFTGSNANGTTYFEGVIVEESNLPFGSNRYSTPWSINVPAAYKYDVDLLRHEFGHVLYSRKFGEKAFVEMAVASMQSVDGGSHKENWTEWTANFLSWQYFNGPSDWKHSQYPIQPSLNNPSYPPMSIFDFYR